MHEFLCAWSHVLPVAKVLPHLLEEVRSEQLQQLVLPLVIHILGKQDKQVRPNLLKWLVYLLSMPHNLVIHNPQSTRSTTLLVACVVPFDPTEAS